LNAASTLAYDDEPGQHQKRPFFEVSFMSERHNHLELFAGWLRSLGEDVEQLGAVVESKAARNARQAVAGGLNYLFKSLDLIPDGMDEIGYLDDAFVLRTAADLAMREDVGDLEPEAVRTLNRLAEDVDAIRSFLGADFARLESYVVGLRKGAVRGRSIGDILDDATTQSAFLGDLRGFARAYQPPTFSREEKSLVKLKAFFEAKLPK
jgi:uncharacterized membrane protein YkvA (DUF1232 family)